MMKINDSISLCAEMNALGKRLATSGVLFLATSSSAFAGGVADAVVEAPVDEAGWHILGIEASLAYADLPGDRLLNFDTGVVDGGDVEYSMTSIDIALNFTSGDLGPKDGFWDGRWIVSPFYMYAFDGVEESFNDEGTMTSSTDTDAGYFEWQEVGLRVEREMYITDVWSWTAGARASYVESEVLSEITSNGTERIKDNEGQHLGLYVGANAILNEHFTVTSRVGYSWVDINESYECRQRTQDTTCIEQTDSDDDDSDLEGPEASIGLRYTF